VWVLSVAYQNYSLHKFLDDIVPLSLMISNGLNVVGNIDLAFGLHITGTLAELHT